MSEAVEIVRRLYAALEASDRIAYRNLTHRDVHWEFMAGYPHGGTRVGWDAIIAETFTPLMEEFSEWHVEVEEILEAGEAVVGLGRYRGRVRKSGVEVTTPFAHIFRLREGKITRVQQFTDTVLFARALGGGVGK